MTFDPDRGQRSLPLRNSRTTLDQSRLLHSLHTNQVSRGLPGTRPQTINRSTQNVCLDQLANRMKVSCPMARLRPDQPDFKYTSWWPGGREGKREREKERLVNWYIIFHFSALIRANMHHQVTIDKVSIAPS